MSAARRSADDPRDGGRIDAALGESLARELSLRGIAWIDRARGRAVWRHRSAPDPRVEAEVLESARGVRSAANVAQHAVLQRGHLLMLFMPFAPDELIAGLTANPPDENTSRALALAANNLLRARIGALLAAGLPDRQDEFPETDHQFMDLIRALRKLPDGDLVGRLALGGFIDRPLGEGENRMRCMECIYYLPHRKWCDLPELPLPVEADWYCRLWKM